MLSSNPVRDHPEQEPQGTPHLSRHRRDAEDAVGTIPNRTLSGMLNRAGWFLFLGGVAGFIAGFITAFSGQMIHQAGGGSNPSPDQVIALGGEPLRRDIVYYPRQFLSLVKRANREGMDLLSDFQALDSAWKPVCPDKPLRIRFCAPTAIDRITGKEAPPVNSSPVAIDRSNFSEYRLHLENVRRLILQGDGTGRGRLPQSGYQAEPTDDL